jgi:uncharacterized protein (TIGR00255 family)
MAGRPIASMTGYARADGQTRAPVALSWVWEARSVNGKGLDLRLRLPPGFDSLDLPIRKLAAEIFSRGSVSLSLTLAGEGSNLGVRVNEDLLDKLIAMAAHKAQHLPTGIGTASLDGLMSVKGVIEPIEMQLDAAALAERDQALLTSLRDALAGLTKAREGEGARLAALLHAQIDRVVELVRAAATSAAAQPEAVKARLERQLAEIAGGATPVTPERLAQEIALLVVKSDIREEIDRLGAHIEQARELLAAGGPCGRRLEFLTQELNREANTLCSKSPDVDLTRIGLDLKATIDQIREQIQNIE